jgi:hypothetical protein
MQTFLISKSFTETAKCLDYRRLGKMRIESYQLLLAMGDENYGWRNHPAFKMWNGYSIALAHYGIAICEEWIRRGYKDTMLDRFMKYVPDMNWVGVPVPSWLGNEKFHSSHRSCLLYKDYGWYSQFGWTEKPAIPISIKKNSVTLPYVWPVQ